MWIIKADPNELDYTWNRERWEAEYNYFRKYLKGEPKLVLMGIEWLWNLVNFSSFA